MLSRLYEEADTELRKVKVERQGQAEENFDLRERLEALEQANRRLETTLAEEEDPRNDISAKAAVIHQFEDQLRMLAEKHAADAKTSAEEAQSLRESLQQQANVVQSLQSSLQNKAADVDRLLKQGEAERLHLEQQLKDEKEKLSSMEAQRLQDAALRESMQQELLKAEASFLKLREKSEETVAKWQRLGAEESSAMNDLRAKLSTSESQHASLRGQTTRYILTTDALCHAVLQWARKIQNSEGVVAALQKLERIRAAGGKGEANKIDEVAQMRNLLDELQKSYRHTPRPPTPRVLPSGDTHESGVTRLPQSLKSLVAARVSQKLGSSVEELVTEDASATTGEASRSSNPVSLRLKVLQTMNAHEQRRVVVQSPVQGPGTPTPLSIDQEKVRRRERRQPKSIMKSRPGPSSQEGSDLTQEPPTEALDSVTAFSRGLYSRPVVGGPGRKEKGETGTDAPGVTRSAKKRGRKADETEAAVRKQLLPSQSQEDGRQSEATETGHDQKRSKRSSKDETVTSRGAHQKPRLIWKYRSQDDGDHPSQGFSEVLDIQQPSASGILGCNDDSQETTLSQDMNQDH